ncbi:MAG: Ig-like domain-containing protein [Candidatus Dormiibacterota bacterium]
MAWMGGWFDPELEDLFHDEPELLETAQRLRSARPQVEADPRFQNRLRAQLFAEASRGRGARGVRRWWRLGPSHFAWGGAFVGAALITATVLTFVTNHPTDETVTAFSQLTAQHSVSISQVITVAFNQPMDQHAVEAGVHIQPAIKVSYTWKDNDLVITPAYHLSANTPYTVTIAQTAIRAASGASAAAPINITFGTEPTPAPGPAAPPSLNPVTLGSNGTGGSLFYASDGSLISTVGLLPTSPTATATPSATPTPSASPTATPEGGITGAPGVPGALVQFSGAGTTKQLGPSPSAAAFSPNGRYLATAVPDAGGGSMIVTSQSDGTHSVPLIDSPAAVTALTWSSNDRIIYTDGTNIVSVDLTKATTQLYTLAGGAGTITELASGGAYAYVAPSTGTGGSLLDIRAGTEQVLSGAGADVAFSGDGKTVAWVDESAQPARLLTEAVGQSAPTVVPMPDSSASPSDVTLDMNGDEAAFLSTNSSGVAELAIVQLPSGTVLAVQSPANASQLTLSPGGDQVAFVSNTAGGASIEQATVPGTRSRANPPLIPAGANATLQRFVQAQVGQDGQPDLGALAALSAVNVDAASTTPQDLSRAYVISTYLEPQGGVGASIELIVDPSSGHTTARVASETLLIAQDPSGRYLVMQAQTSPLRDESAGPHVVQVTSITTNGVTTLQVSFDSDIDPGTVAGSIAVMSASGNILFSTAVYNPDTRTATVTIQNAPSGTLTLDIATTLADFEGQALAHSFETKVQANS